MEYTQIDLKIVCRTCKCEAWEMKPLYYRDPESGKEDPRLDEMLMTCTSVQVIRTLLGSLSITLN